MHRNYVSELNFLLRKLSQSSLHIIEMYAWCEAKPCILLVMWICITKFAASLVPPTLMWLAPGKALFWASFYHHLTPSNYLFCTASVDMLFSPLIIQKCKVFRIYNRWFYIWILYICLEAGNYYSVLLLVTVLAAIITDLVSAIREYGTCLDVYNFKRVTFMRKHSELFCNYYSLCALPSTRQCIVLTAS